MTRPPLSRGHLRTLNQQVGFILNDPLDLFSLFQFQGLGQRGGADQIELAGAIGAFDDLNLGQVSHRAPLYTSYIASQDLWRFFLTFSAFSIQPGDDIARIAMIAMIASIAGFEGVEF
jgi:hypothetical protein